MHFAERHVLVIMTRMMHVVSQLLTYSISASPTKFLLATLGCLGYKEIRVRRSNSCEVELFEPETGFFRFSIYNHSLIGFISKGLQNSNEGCLNAITIISNSNAALQDLLERPFEFIACRVCYFLIAHSRSDNNSKEDMASLILMH